MKLNKLLSVLPSPLPRTQEDFELWAQEVCQMAGVELEDRYRQELGKCILGLPHTQAMKSKWFFVKSVRKSQANGVAYDAIVLAAARGKAAKVQAEASNEQEPV